MNKKNTLRDLGIFEKSCCYFLGFHDNVGQDEYMELLKILLTVSFFCTSHLTGWKFVNGLSSLPDKT